MEEIKVLSNLSYYCLYNPIARGGRTRNHIKYIRDLFEEIGADFRIETSDSVKHAKKLTENAVDDGFNTLVAIGGDGTAHHVANIAIPNRLNFALLPSGSGNDFAGGLGMNGKIEESLEIFREGKIKKFNVVKVTTDTDTYYSINMTDAGLGAEISARAERSLRWMGGPIKYNLISIYEIFKSKAIECRIKLDEMEITRNVRMLIAGLGQTAGSGMHFLPDARFNHDTMQGGIILDNANKLQLAMALQKVRKAEHMDLPFIEMFRAKRLEIETTGEKQLRVESEGELHGRTKMTMEVEKEKFNVLTHPDYSFNQVTVLSKKKM